MENSDPVDGRSAKGSGVHGLTFGSAKFPGHVGCKEQRLNRKRAIWSVRRSEKA